MSEEETFPVTIEGRTVLCRSERDNFLLKRADQMIGNQIGVENMHREQVQDMIEVCHFYELPTMALRLGARLDEAMAD
jgi:hypothetical protein